MKSPEENPLLKEVLHDERLAALRETSLNQGFDTMRRARRNRRVARVGTLALAPVLLLVVLTWRRPAQETASHAPTPGTQQRTVAATPSNNSVKIISDEELFALFPGRSLAWIGRPGNQQLVELDRVGRRWPGRPSGVEN